MRHSLYASLLIFAPIGFVACRGDETGKSNTANPGKAQIDNPGQRETTDSEDEPPLLLEELDETQEDGPAAEGPMADNTRCHVCHANYEDEELAIVHALGEVGCETCHGSSDAHCSDEDNVTPPDIMYAVDQINAACTKCHPKLTDDHEVLLDKFPDKKYCADCHEFEGHRLAYRTRRWDKKTGKLIMSDNVRMGTDDKLE